MEFLKLIWRAYNGHVLIVAFLVGLFAMVMISLQQTLAKAEATVKESLSVVLFLQNTVTDEEAAGLEQTLKSQDPEIISMTYTSKEQALEEAMKDPNLAKSLSLLKTNPLPASFAIRFSDFAWAERAEPAQAVRGIAAVQEIRWDPQARTLYSTLHKWRLWALRFSIFGAIVLFLWATIGVYRFLALRSNAQEIGLVLGVGAAGGVLAWGLWALGMHSIKADISLLQPFWVWLIPLAIGTVAGLGCFGLEVRHAE